ncbi:MAG: J domain-containing protein [Terrimicrobiaceae bacterium]|nr:J domain-containing protein [Terrimicrobiaceae bacterium]
MAVQFRDYYQTLGVAKTAGQDEIKAAFRKLARKYHPDTAEDKKTAEEKFKEINEAYEVLGDPEKRRKYDEFGANWQQGAETGGGAWRQAGGFPGGASARGFDRDEGVDFEFGGTGFSDFFEQMFGARRAGFRAGGFDRSPQRGSDVEADIMVSLEEVFHGSARQISFRRHDFPQVQTYTVKIPKGVREGQRIRLAGQGGAGAAGGSAGDLYLRVRLQKHPDYEIEGGDLYRQIAVPAWKCVLGGSVELATFDGTAKVRIPPRTQGGQKLRLTGYGLPKVGGARGDLYAVVVIELPKHLSAAQEALWKKLADDAS